MSKKLNTHFGKRIQRLGLSEIGSEDDLRVSDSTTITSYSTAVSVLPVSAH